jgi:hypothetical protein
MHVSLLRQKKKYVANQKSIHITDNNIITNHISQNKSKPSTKQQQAAL